MWVVKKSGGAKAPLAPRFRRLCMAGFSLSFLVVVLHHQYHSQLCALGPVLTATIFTEDAVSYIVLTKIVSIR